MAFSSILMWFVHCLLLSPLAWGLATFTDEAEMLRQLQRSHSLVRSEGSHVVMDARGAFAAKAQLGGAKTFPTASDSSHSFYHSTDQLKSEVLRLSKGCNGMLTVKSVNESDVSIDVITVRKAGAKTLNKVFILFGEHSRELISPESGLYFLRALCGDVQIGSADAASVLAKSEFQIVLNANPRSRQKVEEGDFCLRTNPSGVDLNRNWDSHFDSKAMSGVVSNPGPKPFSEPETRIFRKLLTDYAPTTFLTVHSGTRGMYMPWAFDTEHLASYNEPSMMEILKSLDADHCQCPFGAAGKEVGYPCPGTCLDYAYEELKTPFVFAFEIYASPSQNTDLVNRWKEKMNTGGAELLQKGHHLGHPHFQDFFSEHASDFVGNSSASSASLLAKASFDCFDMFNPGTQDDYDTVVKNWAEAYFKMSNLIAQKVLKDGMPKKGVTTSVK